MRERTRVSDTASIYRPETVFIEDNVLLDIIPPLMVREVYSCMCRGKILSK